MTINYLEEIPIEFDLRSNSDNLNQVQFNSDIDSKYDQKKTLEILFQYEPDILGIDNVATILKCSIAKVRRISRHELPARRGPGKCLLYLRKDVFKYFERLPFAGGQTQSDKEDNVNFHNKNFDIAEALSKVRRINA